LAFLQKYTFRKSNKIKMIKFQKRSLVAKVAAGLLFAGVFTMNITNLRSENSTDFSLGSLKAFANGSGEEQQSGSDKCTADPKRPGHGTCECLTKILYYNCFPVGSTSTY
jgi:hypothetical protein